jgi:serine/threonine protein kinase
MFWGTLKDLKPENILLTSNDETAVIKLIDFGFAKEVTYGLGTPYYTPYYPEVLRSKRLGRAIYNESCDIWSLGVIMYILLSGRPPFFNQHHTNLQNASPGMEERIMTGYYTFPFDRWRHVSEDARIIIEGMLETVPERRSTIKDVMRSSWISVN